MGLRSAPAAGGPVDRDGAEVPRGQLTDAVPGSPFQPGDRVRVVQILDETVTATDLGLDPDADIEAYLVGRAGVVHHLNYDCGCGQRYPDDPMIGVLLDGCAAPPDPSEWPEFWPEELSPVPAEPAPGT